MLSNPRISWNTWIWPSQYGPAPIPIVGIVSFSVIIFESSEGIPSRTIEKAPAFSILIESLIIFFASDRILP